MTTFGTSAYLKLLALNSRPRDSEIRRRLGPDKGGYDFHKRMRSIVTAYASGTTDWAATEASLNAIKKVPERQSASSATIALVNWINGRSIRRLDRADQLSQSPNGVFSVKFSPDFEIETGGAMTKIHIWNTIKPPISIREAMGVLGLFVRDDCPQSVGILCLRTNELFLPKDAERTRELARLLAIDIERRVAQIAAEDPKSKSRDRGLDKRTGF